MRESNFALPAQNRACVCITSQLYDRRALDTSSPLPLFNSLSHLTTLSSTSPRIRDILVVDGGLERLIRILRDFCSNPPLPEGQAQFYGLLTPASSNTHSNSTSPPGPPAYDPRRPFDRAAAYRFSLALQCIVNIGVRGSEIIRARVVQAGALDVIGCILEAWLTSRGFAILPSSSASGLPRESREVRHARRMALVAQDETRHAIPVSLSLPPLARANTWLDDEVPNTARPPLAFPQRTISARPPDTRATNELISTSSQRSRSNDSSPLRNSRSSSVNDSTTSADEQTRAGRSTSNGRTDTEAESDADVEMEDADRSADDTSQSASLVQPPPQVDVGMTILEPGLGLNMDLLVGVGVGGVGVNVDPEGIAVDINGRELGIGAAREMALQQQQQQQQLEQQTRARDREHDRPPERTEDLTPRASLTALPDANIHPIPPRQPSIANLHQRTHINPTQRQFVPAPHPRTHMTMLPGIPSQPPSSTARHDAGPYREEDVFLSLQLLAYLSKYPHVRQAFYKPREVFNPALKTMQPNSSAAPPNVKGPESATLAHNANSASLFKSFTNRKDKTPVNANATSTTDCPNPPLRSTPSLLQSTNIFSLVERFTFRPSASELHLPNPPPVLPEEIQHWAGVVMRNACRKDDSRGGIRQCANVQCGKWEKFPREFAKCRRCRKAKYCGKECQSRAWSEGHRFWCCVKEEESDVINASSSVVMPNLSIGTGQREREREREQDEIGNATNSAAAPASASLLNQIQRGVMLSDVLPSPRAESNLNVAVESSNHNSPSQNRFGSLSTRVSNQAERMHPMMTPHASSRVTSGAEASTSSQLSRRFENASPQLPQDYTESEALNSDTQAENSTADELDTVSVFNAPYLHLRARTADFDTITVDGSSLTDIVGRTLSTDLPNIVRTFGVPGPDGRTADLVDEMME